MVYDISAGINIFIVSMMTYTFFSCILLKFVLHVVNNYVSENFNVGCCVPCIRHIDVAQVNHLFL